MANAYSVFGQIAEQDDDFAEACEHHREALRLNEEISHSDGIAAACGQLAELLLQQGKIDEAQKYARRCYSENVKSGNREGAAVALRTLGDVKIANNDYDDNDLDEALTDFKESGRIFEQYGNIRCLIPIKFPYSRSSLAALS